MTDVAFYFEQEAYSADTALLMGRQAAGAAFLRAYAETRPARTWCFARERDAGASFSAMLQALGSPDTAVEWIGLHDVNRLGEPGLMFRPDPAIGVDAWRRLQHAGSRAYSLCGVTHTTATHAVMECFAQLPLAPLEPWDAVICTSRAVRDSVRVIVENQAEYLREKLGAQRFTLPQLPVIPLGVHTADFVRTDKDRATARSALDIGPEQTVFLYLGRLSFVNKAHPLPMLLALEACAKQGPVTLIQAGWFETPTVEQAFKTDAAQLSPSVKCLYLDGRNPDLRRQAWAAADVFTSLPDSIQETFGLTPLEAMAAGLPVVVSDWDGYKETVRDGIDGFRIATLAMPAGSGQSLADRFDFGLDSYHMYCGATSQLVSVNVAAATTAYQQLLNPELRRSMGTAGRARARDAFDWAVIMRRYADLWDELNERRRSDPALTPPPTPRARPDRLDPFATFASYPTAIIAPDTAIRATPEASAEAANRRRRLQTVGYAEIFLPDQDLVAAVLGRISKEEWATFDDLRQAIGGHPVALAAAVIWLAKMGLAETRSQAPRR